MPVNSDRIWIAGKARSDEWIPAIDGLRALAIIAVLIHHSNPATFTNWALGNVGVALFFSISGFLSYYVLWKDEKRIGCFYYGFFLMRRILRIWPAYFTVIILACVMATRDQLLVSSQIPLITFTSNWHLAALKTSQLSTLGILWSIAVEEQFYVVAPFLYKALRSPRWVFVSIGIFVSANLSRWIYIGNFGPSKIGGLYYVTYSYADIFLGGALAAKWYTEGGQMTHKLQSVTSKFSLLLILLATRLWGPFVWPPYNTLTLFPYPILAVVCFLLLSSTILPIDTFLNAVLMSRLLRFIGRLSFSIYLTHVFIIVELLELGMSFGGVWYDVLFASLCVPIAWVLHRGVERPFLDLKSRLNPTDAQWPTYLTWTLLIVGSVRYFWVS